MVLWHWLKVYFHCFELGKTSLRAEWLETTQFIIFKLKGKFTSMGATYCCHLIICGYNAFMKIVTLTTFKKSSVCLLVLVQLYSRTVMHRARCCRVKNFHSNLHWPISQVPTLFKGFERPFSSSQITILYLALNIFKTLF